MREVRKDLKKKVKGADVIIQDMSLRGFAATRGFPIEFVVQGPHWEELTENTKRMMDALKKSGLAVDVNTDVQEGMPEVKVTPDRKKLALHGVSISS